MTAPVADMAEHLKYTPMLEEIEAAFKAVFPEEQIRDVEYIGPPDQAQEIFAIRSDKMVRRYLRSDQAQSFLDILRDTPHVPDSKE